MAAVTTRCLYILDESKKSIRVWLALTRKINGPYCLIIFFSVPDARSILESAACNYTDMGS